MRRLAKLLIVLAAAFAVATVIVSLARHAPRAVDGEAFVTVDGVRVRYVQAGSGPDVVLIHGASGNLTDMTFRLLPALAGRYRVTAFDRPGLGASDPIADLTPAAQGRHLAAAAEAIGIERPIVLGHSYGGAVALAWGLDRQDEVAAVVDVSGAVLPWPGGLNWTYRIAEGPVLSRLTPWLVSAWAPSPLVDSVLAATFAPEPVPEGYADHFDLSASLGRGPFSVNARQVLSLREALVAQSTDYGTLTMPVEIVHGDADPVVGIDIHSRPLAELVPGAALTVIPGAGHMPHQTHTEVVVAAVDRAAARAGVVTGLDGP